VEQARLGEALYERQISYGESNRAKQDDDGECHSGPLSHGSAGSDHKINKEGKNAGTKTKKRAARLIKTKKKKNAAITTP